MWTYLTKFLAYNLHELKNYTTKTPMMGNWFQCISLIMHLGKMFYANILQSWKRGFSHFSYTPRCRGSQFVWFNNYIIMDNNFVYFKQLSSHNCHFINQLNTSEGEFKDWNHIKREFQLTNSLHYKFTQISHPIPKKWKQKLRKNGLETLC